MLSVPSNATHVMLCSSVGTVSSHSNSENLVQSSFQCEQATPSLHVSPAPFHGQNLFKDLASPKSLGHFSELRDSGAEGFLFKI